MSIQQSDEKLDKCSQRIGIKLGLIYVLLVILFIVLLMLL